MDNKEYSVSTTVSSVQTARSMESGSLKVFATPAMIALMEQAACGCVADMLSEDKTSVGTEMNVRHVAATPVGMKVTATAELTGIDGRELHFRVRAEDEAGLIGEGTHTRVVVDAARFQQKADGKGEPAHGDQNR